MTRNRIAPAAGRPHGRRRIGSRERISAVALRLFVSEGYEETSMERIAEESGISRRTLFRYFPTKADLPWGDFTGHVERLRHYLAESDPDIPIPDVLRRMLVDFNSFPESETSIHRARMRLLLATDALTAHSAIMYADWRRAVSEFVARRLETGPDEVLPSAWGHALLGVALAAYERWIASPDSDQAELHRLLTEGAGILRGTPTADPTPAA